ncbi:hypothetical protein BDF20DRAFT_295434 [Mycotypha africana]|uniref:uncharacterized protein n=1 Tax=Mycotypha africana TaxID=64632 RepID=UPI00230010A1|nr:uncharacterized protein BDF20DRAFT_295434 [Mycotypha africana]KAI8987915.1 hypothetical protein BDF20DRAFT_295434 [Mycotypha africana]
MVIVKRFGSIRVEVKLQVRYHGRHRGHGRQRWKRNHRAHGRHGNQGRHRRHGRHGRHGTDGSYRRQWQGRYGWNGKDRTSRFWVPDRQPNSRWDRYRNIRGNGWDRLEGWKRHRYQTQLLFVNDVLVACFLSDISSRNELKEASEETQEDDRDRAFHVCVVLRCVVLCCVVTFCKENSILFQQASI